ncbi:MAG: C4-type zinc ribbon domain-containing protein [Actinomycetota bacterium]
MTLAQLLVLQAHDSAMDRLRHQRAQLPELQAIADCDDEAAHLHEHRAVLEEQRHALSREQKRHEDEVAIIEDRRASENDRLYSGTVTAHKDLQAIQAELDVLAQRQEAIEDQVLELMEQAEPLDEGLASFDTRLAQVAERRLGIETQLAESEAAIDAEISSEQDDRERAASEVDAGLLGAYERTRADLGGIAVGRLNGKTCEGCHLQLSAVDFDRIRKEPADAVIPCPECERILVRD